MQFDNFLGLAMPLRRRGLLLGGSAAFSDEKCALIATASFFSPAIHPAPQRVQLWFDGFPNFLFIFFKKNESYRV